MIKTILSYILITLLHSCSILFNLVPSQNFSPNGKEEYLINLDALNDKKRSKIINTADLIHDNIRDYTRIYDNFAIQPKLHKQYIIMVNNRGKIALYNTDNKHITWSKVISPNSINIHIEEGIIIHFDENGTISALQLHSGQLLWQHKTISPQRGDIISLNNSSIAFSTSNGSLCILDYKTGKMRWYTIEAQQNGNITNKDGRRLAKIESHPTAIASKRSQIIIHTNNHKASLFTILNGIAMQQWLYESPQYSSKIIKNTIPLNDIITDEKYAYISVGEDDIIALTLIDGSVKWRNKIPVSQKISLNQDILLLSHDNTLTAVNTEDGSIIEKYILKKNVNKNIDSKLYNWTSATSVSNMFVVSEKLSGSMIIFDKNGLDPIKFITANKKFVGSPVVSNGSLFLFYYDGSYSKISAKDLSNFTN